MASPVFLRFNSTLVQLKGVNPTPAALMEQSFNSTLVQLKVNIQVLSGSGQKCFNSTLVQLKVDLRSIYLWEEKVSILP